MQLPLTTWSWQCLVALVLLSPAGRALPAQDEVRLSPRSPAERAAACDATARQAREGAQFPPGFSLVFALRSCGIPGATLGPWVEARLAAAAAADDVPALSQLVYVLWFKSRPVLWERLVALSLSPETPIRARRFLAAHFLAQPLVRDRYKCWSIPGNAFIDSTGREVGMMRSDFMHIGPPPPPDHVPPDALIARFREAMVRIAADSASDPGLRRAVRCLGYDDRLP